MAFGHGQDVTTFASVILTFYFDRNNKKDDEN